MRLGSVPAPAEPIQFGDPGLHPDHYAKPGAVGDQIASGRGLAQHRLDFEQFGVWIPH
jgi:hypothetical protein